ncbi:MAG: beta-galactosidase trimerization domain-containing protein [Terracidiphilus sp.]
MESSRRTFLKQTAAVSAASLVASDAQLSVALLKSAESGAAANDAGWYSRPMRWAQLSFVESDPGNYDLAFWLDYFKRVHAEAAILNAGGCVAFYPTQIPLHYRSKWLGNMDAFGDIAAGCRKLGMNVVARTDPHACHQDVYDAHPDWIAVDESGSKRRHASDSEFWLTCALGPYNFEFMTQVHQEIMTRYKVDGIFTNRWAGSGMCYCEHCRENFRTFSGMDLPRTLDPQNPARREYLIWHQQRLFELWRLWNTKIQQINPGASFIPNTGGGALSELDMKTTGELATTLIADRQGRSGEMAPWMNGKSAKEFRSTMGNKAVPAIFSVGLEDKYRWKDSVQNGDEIRLWVADGIAQGFRPAFTKFNARPFDKRWFPVVEEIFQWHYANQDYFRNERSYARVGMVYSQQTAAFYGGTEAAAKVDNPALGFYQALIEARVPFEMVHDRLLDREHIDRYRTLILPNIAALSAEQCGQIREFVERGGSIVATYETSLYDEWGVQREDFGLAALFGASYAGSKEGPMLNSYLELERDRATGQYHPLLAGFEDAGRIINSIHRVHVNPVGEQGDSPLKVIPTYPDLPMEECFPRPVNSHDAGVFLRQAGQGRVVYFPLDIDSTFWEVMNVDHAKLLRNAVLWAANEPMPVTVEGRGVVDVSIWGQRNSMTVHLVNMTNPMMMKGPVREVIPLSGQKLLIRVPDGRRVSKVHLLAAGKPVPYREENGAIALEVPTIDVHEVVALDFEA